MVSFGCSRFAGRQEAATMASKTRTGNSEKYNKHMDLDERNSIANIIATNRDRDGSMKITLASIGRMLGKDPTSISKEVRNRRTAKTSDIKVTPRNYCEHCRNRHSCSEQNLCPTHCGKFCRNCANCFNLCPSFIFAACPHTTHFPWVCNGCSKRAHCRYPHYYYQPKTAQAEYETLKSECREGINMSLSEFSTMNQIVSDGLKKGQSIAHIVEANKDRIPVSQRQIYTYLHKDLFYAGIMDSRRIPKMKPRKKKDENPIVVRKAKTGRTFEDFQGLLMQDLSLAFFQIDTVEGKQGGKVLLTLHCVKTHFQFAFLLDSKHSINVVKTFDHIQNVLGMQRFQLLFSVLLADNGVEFSDIQGIEVDSATGEKRSSIYFCHPNSAFEKGACEKNHELIRCIIPKGASMDHLTQNKINLMMSHINSYKRKSTDFSTPYDLFCATYGQGILDTLCISRIPENEVMLRPALLK